MAKINWNPKLTKLTNYKLESGIINAEISTKEFRSEINRIFTIARKRINAINESGLYSPAALSVKNDTFTISDKSFFDLKMEYGRAISFLKQPTSTLSGLKSYNQSLMSKYDIPEKEFNEMSKRLNDNNKSLSYNDYIEWFFMQYKDFTDDIENYANEIEQGIERESVNIVEQIDRDIENQIRESEQIKAQIAEVIYDSLKQLIKK